MSILSSLFAIFKRIFKKLFELLKKILKAIWPLLLIGLAIYFFGPAIGTWLSKIGAPSWLSSIFTGFPAWINGLGSSFMTWIGGLGSSFLGAELSTQAMILGGTALLLAPEETGELIGEIAEVGGDLIGTIVGGATSGLMPLILAGIGVYLLYTALTKEKSEPTYLQGDYNDGPSSTYS